jgi:NADH-quinone oxidoreductase subunit L
MYHLTTHAFFKALLFLAAGSVIHGTHEQDIGKLGGLWRPMRWTSLTFLIGALALCGLWPFSGFFSKDEILVLAHEHHMVVYGLATLTAGLTAFYTARAWCVAFTGTFRGHGHPHESPPVMLFPLFVLAALSAVGGFLGLPHLLGDDVGHIHWDVALTSLGIVAIGLLLAWLMYGAKKVSPQQVVHALALPYSFVKRRYYIDEGYAWCVANIQQKLIAGTCAWIERYVIIGIAVNGIALLAQGLGRLLRLVQTGKVQAYALGFLLGVICLLTAIR